MIDTKISLRRAVVTGATGYVGSSLARRLCADGWDVHVVVRPDSSLALLSSCREQITVHKHDGTTSGMIQIMQQARPEVVFHLASLFMSQHKPEDINSLITSNLLFSTQLVEAMAEAEVKCLVNTGTSWQHYQNECYNPVNLYAATKQSFEDILAYYIEARDLKVSTLALFDTYGPHDPRPKLISLLWNTALNQEKLAMSLGEQIIDLVYIDDVIDAFLLAADTIKYQDTGHCRYGVSSGKPIRLIDLVTVFEKVTGLELPIIWGARAYRPREVMTTWTNFVTVPGWVPRISLEDGIRQSRPF